MDAFFHAIYTTKGPIDPASGRNKSRSFVALLGPHCSDVTERVAGVTSYWNIVQVRTIKFETASKFLMSSSATNLFYYFEKLNGKCIRNNFCLCVTKRINL